MTLEIPGRRFGQQIQGEELSLRGVINDSLDEPFSDSSPAKSACDGNGPKQTDIVVHFKTGYANQRIAQGRDSESVHVLFDTVKRQSALPQQATDVDQVVPTGMPKRGQLNHFS